jgi:hypothetical protein
VSRTLSLRALTDASEGANSNDNKRASPMDQIIVSLTIYMIDTAITSFGGGVEYSTTHTTRSATTSFTIPRIKPEKQATIASCSVPPVGMRQRPGLIANQ